MRTVSELSYLPLTPSLAANVNSQSDEFYTSRPWQGDWIIIDMLLPCTEGRSRPGPAVVRLDEGIR